MYVVVDVYRKVQALSGILSSAVVSTHETLPLKSRWGYCDELWWLLVVLIIPGDAYKTPS